MAFALEHFPTFPYPPSGMQEVGEVERYLTSLHRSMQEFFSLLPRDIKDGISVVDLDDLANTTLSDPNADRIVFWDDGAGVYTWLTANTGLAISGTNLNLSHLGLEALADPGADRIFFWDDGETASKWLAPDGTTLEISGTTLKFVTNPHILGYFDFDEIADPGAPSASDVRLFANDMHIIALCEDDHWHDLSAGATGVSSHIHDAITVSDANGLNVTWSAGVMHDALLTGQSQRVDIAAQPSNQATTAVSMNFLYFDKSGGVVALTTDIDAIDFSGGDFPIASIGTDDDDITYLDHFKVGHLDVQNIKHVLWHMFQAVVGSGLIASEHSGGAAFDIDVSVGAYIHDGYDVHTVAATIDSTSTNIVRWFHNASNNWTTDANAEIDEDNWDDDDDSSGVKSNNNARYYRSTFYVVGDVIHWVYPQVEYTTLNQALEANDPTPPAVLEHFPKSTSLVMRGDAAALPAAGSDQWIDVRPTLGAVGTGGTISDHGNLAGLADDDHTQYTLHSLADAVSDFLVASGANTFVKKTLAETGAILEADLDHGSIQGLDDNDHGAVYYTETEIDTWRNSVSQTEMGYLDGVTGDIQTQLDARALESVFGTSIGAGLLLDGTVLKTDVELQAIAGLTSAADRYIRYTGSGTADLRTYANMLTDLSGSAGAAFAWNSQNLTGIGTMGCGAITSSGELIVTNIQFTTGVMDRNTDAGELKFRSSATDEKGASIKLYGGSHGTFPGNMYLDFGDLTAAIPAGATLNVRVFDNSAAITALKIDANAHLHVWDWDDSALREVDFGADDSGGSGYKVLRIPN